MSLLNPSALLWFALALPIVLFYILKIRLRRVPVSTILFWQQIFEQKQPRSIWEHLRHLLSLLVQMAMLSLLVFALTEPFFRWEAQGARRIVLVVDNSASMNARDEGTHGTRLDQAKAEARRIIDGLRYNDEMAIVAAGTEPQVRCGLTDHQTTLREAIEATPPTDGPTKVVDAVSLARRLLADKTAHRRVIVLTDGGFEGVDILARADDVTLVGFGTKTGNVGITQFQVRRSLLDPIGFEILAEVVNASDKATSCRLEIDLNEDVVDVVPLKLEPGQRWSQTFEKTSAEGGVLSARLSQGEKAEPLADALSADNEAVALLPRRESRPVTLVTPGNWFLRRVFEAIPLVALSTTTEVPREFPKGGVTVFHRTVPEHLPSGPVLVIDPQTGTDLWSLGEPLANPIVLQQDSNSPLMPHVKLENLTMAEARALTPKEGVRVNVLASALTEEPLYLEFDRPEGKVLVLTVNLDKSDLPFLTAFPILMTNAMADFAGQKGELREAVSAGGLAEVGLPARDDLVLRTPDGRILPLPSGANRAAIGPLDRRGIWQVVRKADVETLRAEARSDEVAAPVAEVACNVSSRRETDLRPPEGWRTARAGFGGGFGARPVWYYLIALAWLLAAAEWFLYQRRWIS